jgi:hypothetical protein
VSPNHAILDELEEARPDLEDILVEVLSTVFADEAYAVEPAPFPGAVEDLSTAVSRLEIHDPGDDSYTVIEVRLGVEAAQALASRMLQLGSPGSDDLLDAVGELGNIAAGNVKSLLRQTTRLSLPSARLERSDSDDQVSMVKVAAMVQGHLVQLGVIPADKSDGALWPGTSLIS